MEEGRGTEGGEAVGGLPSWAGRQEEPEGCMQHPRLTPTARQAKYIHFAVQPPHRPAPELFHVPKQKPSPLNTHSQLRACAIPLSVSMNLMTLGTSCGWDHTASLSFYSNRAAPVLSLPFPRVPSPDT